MSYRVQVTEPADKEARQAKRWYEDQRPGLGKFFAQQVADTFRAIKERPLSFPIFYLPRHQESAGFAVSVRRPVSARWRPNLDYRHSLHQPKPKGLSLQVAEMNRICLSLREIRVLLPRPAQDPELQIKCSCRKPDFR